MAILKNPIDGTSDDDGDGDGGDDDDDDVDTSDANIKVGASRWWIDDQEGEFSVHSDYKFVFQVEIERNVKANLTFIPNSVGLLLWAQ